MYQEKGMVLNIAIDSLGSTEWPMECSTDVIRFLYQLKQCMRQTTSVCYMTVLAWMYRDFFNVSHHPLIRKMEHAADAVLEIESFQGTHQPYSCVGSPRHQTPIQSDFSGFIHPLKLFRMNSLTPMTRLSSLTLKSMGFKVYRKKFMIEVFSLPPEDQSQEKSVDF